MTPMRLDLMVQCQFTVVMENGHFLQLVFGVYTLMQLFNLMVVTAMSTLDLILLSMMGVTGMLLDTVLIFILRPVKAVEGEFK